MVIPRILTLNELETLRQCTVNCYKTLSDGMTAHQNLWLSQKGAKLQANLFMADPASHLQKRNTLMKTMIMRTWLQEETAHLRHCLKWIGLISAAEEKGIWPLAAKQNPCSTKSVSGRSARSAPHLLVILFCHPLHIHKLSIQPSHPLWVCIHCVFSLPWQEKMFPNNGWDWHGLHRLQMSTADSSLSNSGESLKHLAG